MLSFKSRRPIVFVSLLLLATCANETSSSRSDAYPTTETYKAKLDMYTKFPAPKMMIALRRPDGYYTTWQFWPDHNPSDTSLDIAQNRLCKQFIEDYKSQDGKYDVSCEVIAVDNTYYRDIMADLDSADAARASDNKFP